MKTPSLLEQAKAFAQQNRTGSGSAGAAALRILPLAAATVAAPLAAHGASNVIFQPANPTYNNQFPFSFQPVGGSGSTTTAGSAALPGFNNIIGEKSFGHVDYSVSGGQPPEVAGGRSAVEGASSSFNFNAVTVQGNRGGSGGTFQLGDTVPVKFTFTLATNSPGLFIGNWTLTFSINVGVDDGSGGGTADNFVTFSGNGAGTFSDFGIITIAELGDPVGGGSGSFTPFNGYSAILNLTINEDPSTFSGGTFSIDIPQNSLDFNAIIPEPSTWWLLTCGTLAGGGFAWRRRRQLRPASEAGAAG